MIFSELYSVYYHTVARILQAAVQHPPVTAKEISQLVEKYAFSESMLEIPAALKEERWPLLHRDGTTPLGHVPEMPLTLLQKRWLKAISLDPRIRLFGEPFPQLEGIEPLFTQEDYRIFDRYADGDPMEDPGYVERFQLILQALREQSPLSFEVATRRGGVARFSAMPRMLEYSEKDDKFRLYTVGCRYGKVVNLANIRRCSLWTGERMKLAKESIKGPDRYLVLELEDRRNALERVMLHFAHFKKEAERLENGRYRVRVEYRKDDETELVIRVLSFGPMVRVTEPESFIDLIRQRLVRQMHCQHKDWEGDGSSPI